jgi:hypothetical protein
MVGMVVMHGGDVIIPLDDVRQKVVERLREEEDDETNANQENNEAPHYSEKQLKISSESALNQRKSVRGSNVERGNVCSPKDEGGQGVKIEALLGYHAGRNKMMLMCRGLWHRAIFWHLSWTYASIFLDIV